MIYECPSCKLKSQDGIEPLLKLSHPLCVFCSSKHTQKELLNWQMYHLKEIDKKHFPMILRHFYMYIENQLTTWEERFNDQDKIIQEFRGKDSPRSTEEK